jgi:phosphatidylethanolamine-binding protein (PEBP) family uncharacterized protein
MTHHYVIGVLTYDIKLDQNDRLTEDDLVFNLSGHLVSQGYVYGSYTRARS